MDESVAMKEMSLREKIEVVIEMLEKTLGESSEREQVKELTVSH